jgi:RNA polymerase sigma-70 factor (ECF subfamily)
MDRQRRERFAAGDRSILSEVYGEFGKPIYSLAYRILGDHGRSEEVVQMTMLKAWRGAGRFDPDKEMAPWLYTIARRAAIDVYRRERRHPVSGESETDIAILPPSLDQTWEAWQVHMALNKITEEEREIMRCTHFLGMTHEQAAKYLEIPVGTVKSRSHRAHARLAGLLSHLEEATA